MKCLRKAYFALAAFSAASAMCLPSTANAAAAVLAAGTYKISASSYTLCSAKLDKNGDTFSGGTFLYAGAGKSGSSLISATATTLTDPGSIYIRNILETIKLPVASSAAPGTWSGPFTGTAYSYISSSGLPGTSTTPSLSGTISISLTALTTNTFYGEITFKAKGQSSCTLQVVGGP